jgi:hypothetical protein
MSVEGQVSCGIPAERIAALVERGGRGVLKTESTWWYDEYGQPMRRGAHVFLPLRVIPFCCGVFSIEVAVLAPE